MEAKLKYKSLECWDPTFDKQLRKEESQDCVVPDTLPDIDQVLCTLGGLNIRSKDVSAGRLRLEANIPARIVFCDEQGGVHSMELNVPVYISADDESFGEGSLCCAELRLTALETRLLNPRKVLTRAEISADISCYSRSKSSWTIGVEEAEHIHVLLQPEELNYVGAVTEKTFALTDEQALPAGLEPGELVPGAVEVFSDDIKRLGSKLVVKGRIKSHMLMLSENGLTPMEATTDFSQIIECDCGENALVSLHITPSGSYHYISSDSGEARLCMEFHLVAQLKCCETMGVRCLSDAYSNCFELSLQPWVLSCCAVQAQPSIRCSLRQLYELRDMAQLLFCSHIWGCPRYAGDKLCVPLALQCVYRDEAGTVKSEKLCAEMSVDVPENCAKTKLRSIELTDCSLAPMPGGVELRVSAQAEILALRDGAISFVGGISYDESSPIDTSRKPSLVLLRASNKDDLWTLARENCSTVEEIIAANKLDDAPDDWEKLLLIPKSY